MAVDVNNLRGQVINGPQAEKSIKKNIPMLLMQFLMSLKKEKIAQQKRLKTGFRKALR